MSGRELRGRVVRGEGWGRKLGYPTANLDHRFFRRHPVPPGVYACWASVGRKRYRAIAVVGVPYTWRRHGFKVELHLLSFRRNLHGRLLTATVVQKLRPIKVFQNVPEMLRTIARDVAQTKRLLR
ncbi:MAG: riboflavin kinase [Candidatus Kerfeldbacteria bacterium]|nr:riboflavin kinase [Candidatus Kerfeldbacteria bacterium]